MIPDRRNSERGLSVAGDGRDVRVVVIYDGRHRGSVSLSPDRVLELIRDLAAAVTR
jgi:hypothetical protein